MGWCTKSWHLNSSLLQLPIYIESQGIGKTEFSSQGVDSGDRRHPGARVDVIAVCWDNRHVAAPHTSYGSRAAKTTRTERDAGVLCARATTQVAETVQRIERPGGCTLAMPGDVPVLAQVAHVVTTTSVTVRPT
jgi:hypothetical protein